MREPQSWRLFFPHPSPEGGPHQLPEMDKVLQSRPRGISSESVGPHSVAHQSGLQDDSK